jgi:hypothetical protein
VGARVQVRQRAAGQVARDTLAGEGGERELGAEARDDAVDHRGADREADEPPAPRVLRPDAAAGGLHARLLEQRAVGGEQALVRVLGGGERAVVLGDPELGVLGVEDLVDRDAVGAQDRAALQLTRADLRRGTEQLVAVEVDGAAAQLDVAGLGEPGADERPDGEELLEDQRPAVGELAVERVELAALGGGPGELGGEAHRVTARG